MKKFSVEWKSSTKPGKQRKYRFNAPLHIKQKFVSAHLSKDLRQKLKKRNVDLRKGDKVKVMRGKFKKHEGKVDRVDLKKSLIFVSGVESTKRDGTKRPLALNPSNLMITELNMEDKQRQKIMERK